MIQLVASDLDGTLLQNNSQSLNEEIFLIINQLYAKGILFTAASGRQYPNLRRLFEPVKDKIAYICENGALTMYKEQIISRRPMDRTLGIELIQDIISHKNAEILISGQNTSYVMPKSMEYLSHITETIKNTATVIHDITEVTEPFLKISVYEKDGIDNLAENHYYPRWKDKFQCAVSDHMWMDFTSYGVNKGTALTTLLQHTKLEPKQVMAFGDSYNDTEILSMAGLSYAMENAKTEIQKLCEYRSSKVEDTLTEVFHLNV